MCSLMCYRPCLLASCGVVTHRQASRKPQNHAAERRFVISRAMGIDQFKSPLAHDSEIRLPSGGLICSVAQEGFNPRGSPHEPRMRSQRSSELMAAIEQSATGSPPSRRTRAKSRRMRRCRCSNTVFMEPSPISRGRRAHAGSETPGRNSPASMRIESRFSGGGKGQVALSE